MRLKDWLYDNRMSCERLARQLDCCANYMWMISAGRKKPSRRLAKDISAATEGKVSISDLIQESNAEKL